MNLGKAMGVSDTVLQLAGASNFPNAGGIVQIDSENIGYMMSSDDALYNLTRGMNGTTAATHLAGALITLLEGAPFIPNQPPVVQTDAVQQAFNPPTKTISSPLAVLPTSYVDLYNVLNVIAPVASNITLGRASTFAVLGDTAVSNTGFTVLHGDLGISPGSSITGFPPGTYTGSLHQTDTAAANAHTDATAAAAALTATGPGTSITSTDLGGYTAVPGTYSAAAAGTWSAGPLTLNGAGTYIFLFGSSLTVPANGSVVLTNGATADNVYFVTGTTFTFGANNLINGNILAGTSITFASNSVLNGRALTYGPSGTTVTFPSAGTVNVPTPANTQNWTLPTPTLNNLAHIVWVTVSGSNNQIVNGVTITPGMKHEFAWDILAQAWAQ
jgi:hypothetical protein